MNGYNASEYVLKIGKFRKVYVITIYKDEEIEIE